MTHENTRIGKNCKIAQNVTFGAKWSKKESNAEAPRVGDFVTIGAGAVLLGKIFIGDHAVIGANSVVLHDIPANTLAVGVPAKVVKRYQ